MDMEVFDCGKPVGKLHLEKTGLYQTVDCACRPDSGGILRVFVWRGMDGACLGVLCPEGMDFTLHRRVSRAGLPFTPELAVVGCEDDGFWPWRGEFDGAWIDDGYLKKTPEGESLALPTEQGKPALQLPHWQPEETRVICGRDCTVLIPKPPVSPPAPPAQTPVSSVPEPEPPVPAPRPQPPEEVLKPQEEPQTRFHFEE